MGRSSSFFWVIPSLPPPSVFPLMDSILLARQGTAQFASGTSRPISQLENHSCTTTNSWPLLYRLMENILLVLETTERFMYGTLRQLCNGKAIMCACLFIVSVFAKWGLIVLQSADASDAKPDAKLMASHLCFSFVLYLISSPGTCSSTETCTPNICESSFFIHLVRSLMPVLVSKQQPNNRGLAKYVGAIFRSGVLASLTKIQGKDFWDADINSTSHPAAPPANPLSTLHWRNFLGSLHVSTRPPSAPHLIPLETRRWNLNLFRGGSSISTVEVAAGRKKNVSGLHRFCSIFLK